MKKSGPVWDAVKDCGLERDETRAIRASWGEAETLEEFVALTASTSPVAFARLAVDMSRDEHAARLLESFGAICTTFGDNLSAETRRQVEAAIGASPPASSGGGYVAMILLNARQALALGVPCPSVSAVIAGLAREGGTRSLDRLSEIVHGELGPFVLERLRETEVQP